jgi:hypothetical protein
MEKYTFGSLRTLAPLRDHNFDYYVSIFYGSLLSNNIQFLSNDSQYFFIYHYADTFCSLIWENTQAF